MCTSVIKLATNQIKSNIAFGSSRPVPIWKIPYLVDTRSGGPPVSGEVTKFCPVFLQFELHCIERSLLQKERVFMVTNNSLFKNIVLSLEVDGKSVYLTDSVSRLQLGASTWRRQRDQLALHSGKLDVSWSIVQPSLLITKILLYYCFRSNFRESGSAFCKKAFGQRSKSEIFRETLSTKTVFKPFNCLAGKKNTNRLHLNFQAMLRLRPCFSRS